MSPGGPPAYGAREYLSFAAQRWSSIILQAAAALPGGSSKRVRANSVVIRRVVSRFVWLQNNSPRDLLFPSCVGVDDVDFVQRANSPTIFVAELLLDLRRSFYNCSSAPKTAASRLAREGRGKTLLE